MRKRCRNILAGVYVFNIIANASIGNWPAILNALAVLIILFVFVDTYEY